MAAGSEEKPAIAARVAWSGAGINLKTGKPTPEQIRTAVRQVLTNPHYQQKAQAQLDFEGCYPTFREEARKVFIHDNCSGLFPEGEGPVNPLRSR